nr:MAG TPA: hypothetical protein [Caudoviricetes sp.]
MSLYNDFVLNGLDSNHSTEELEGIGSRANDAARDLMLGISAIGSLMFWAADSDNYAEETAKADMYRIGAMLGTIGEVVRALNDTAANAGFSLSDSGNASKLRAAK